MMRREKFAIANIYVPVKRRKTLKPETVQEIAQSILEVGQQLPILVRRDGDRFVLVHGLHRLEACKALGEERSTDTSPKPRSTNPMGPCCRDQPLRLTMVYLSPPRTS